MTLNDILVLRRNDPRVFDALACEKLLDWRWWRSASSGRRCLYSPGQNPGWMQTPADGTELLVGDWMSMPLVDFSNSADADLRAHRVACWWSVEKRREYLSNLGAVLGQRQYDRTDLGPRWQLAHLELMLCYQPGDYATAALAVMVGGEQLVSKKKPN